MRIIDKKELKEWIENWFTKNKYYHPYSKSNNIPIDELYDILEQMPTIDAEPIRHGKWTRDYESSWGDSRFMCSVCHCKESVPTCNGEPTIWDYCPNCGAKMIPTIPKEIIDEVLGEDEVEE